MKKTALIIALGAISGVTLSAQPEGHGPRGDRPAVEDVAAMLLENFDADSSGSLDLTEFETAMKEHRKQIGRQGPRGKGQADDLEADRPQPAPNSERAAKAKKRMTEAFTTADVDGNGTLDSAELAQAMKAMQPDRRGGRQGPMRD